MKELNVNKYEEVNGGVLQFIAGALVGGVIYDAAKAGFQSYIENYENPYPGISSSDAVAIAESTSDPLD